MLTLVSRRIAPSFDKEQFREAHSDLWAAYQRTTVTQPKGSLRFSSRVALAKMAPDKVALKKCLAAKGVAFTTDQTLNDVASRTDEIVELHDQFVRSLGPLSRAEWLVERSKAAFASRLGIDESIDGICTWKRAPATKIEFDEKSFRHDHPDHYDQFLRPASSAVSVKINFHRPYAHQND